MRIKKIEPSVQYRVTNIDKYKITLKFEEVGAKIGFLCVFASLS